MRAPAFNNLETALAWAEANRVRVRVHYGDTETGRDWGDVHWVAGTIGRSTGREPIRLLIHNRRSMGGGALHGSIVRVRFANRSRGGDLYRHPTYTPPDRLTWQAPASVMPADDWRRHFGERDG